MKDVEAIVLVARWKKFEKLLEMLQAAIALNVVVDGCRMLDGASIVKYADPGLKLVLKERIP